MENKYSDRLHNAMIEAAVCDYWEKVISDTDWSKNDNYAFSKQHMAKIKAILRKQKLKALKRKVMRACYKVAVIILIFCSVTFATMMSSSALREEMRIIGSKIIELFSKIVGSEPTGEEFYDFQTDQQIEQIEGTVASALEKEGLPQNTSFQLHIDGYLNMRLTGLDNTTTAKIWPYINHQTIADILSTAYATENKNQLYYLQSITRSYKALPHERSDDLQATAGEYRKIIREYLFTHSFETAEEIMEQERTVNFKDGKLIFVEK